MTNLRRRALWVVAALMIGGCAVFDDDRPSRRQRERERQRDRDEQRAERCEVQVDQYKERVRRFKKSDYRKKDTFRAAKDELLRELERIDTPACRRELGDEIAELIDEVRDERF